MITPGELWFGRTAGTRVRLSSRRICRGGALSPPAVHGLMDVLYGPTDMSARTRSVEGDTTGGHTGPPLRDHRSAQPPQRGGTEPAPYRCATGSAQQRADVPRAWLPPAKFRNGIWGVSHRHRPLRPAGDEGRHAGSSCPTGGCGEPPQLPWVAAHSGASAARMGGMGGDRSRDHPKGTINAGQSLSQPVADSSCCGTQNSLLAYAHRILTAATPFCSLLPPLAALANVPLYTREPWGRGMRIAVTSAPNFGT